MLKFIIIWFATFFGVALQKLSPFTQFRVNFLKLFSRYKDPTVHYEEILNHFQDVDCNDISNLKIINSVYLFSVNFQKLFIVKRIPMCILRRDRIIARTLGRGIQVSGAGTLQGKLIKLQRKDRTFRDSGNIFCWFLSSH